MGSKLGESQLCALAAQDASSISGLHEHGHSSGDRGKGYAPHSALVRPYLRTAASSGPQSTGKRRPSMG